MDNTVNLDEILSLSEEELKKIFDEMTLEEIEDLIQRVKEVTKND
jgi:hypothetical protein